MDTVTRPREEQADLHRGLCSPWTAIVGWSLVRKLLWTTWSCSNCASRLAKLQTPQETMVTAAIWGRTLRERRPHLGLPERICKDSVGGCRDTSGRGLGITAPPLVEVKPSAPSGFSLSLFSVTWCSDTNKDLGLCMDHESRHKAYTASRPGRSVSGGSGAPWEYSHLCAVEYCLNSCLCVLKQITITRIITTVASNSRCHCLHFWEESQLLRWGIGALLVALRMFPAAFPWVPKNSVAEQRSDRTGHKAHHGPFICKQVTGEHKGQTVFLVFYFLHDTWEIFIYHQKKKKKSLETDCFMLSFCCSFSDPWMRILSFLGTKVIDNSNKIKISSY